MHPSWNASHLNKWLGSLDYFAISFSFLFSSLLVVGFRWWRNYPKWQKLPPGPKGIPFLGNIFDLSDDAWLKFTEWKDVYGPIVHLNMAGQHMVVLNTYKVATELLDHRARNYSDRPRYIVASEFLTGGLFMVFTDYGAVWQRMHRAAHEGLNKSATHKYRPAQTQEAQTLVSNLLSDPDEMDSHLMGAAASTTASLVYNVSDRESKDYSSIARISEFVERIGRAAYPGAHLVEFFPWMKFLPSWMAKWKRDAERWYKEDTVMFEDLYRNVKKRAAEGNEGDSFAASLISQQERNGLNDRESAWLAATIYVGGAETTAAVLAWFMIAMITYPEVQKRAQSELDDVVGRSRMPTFSDFEHLPYIRAIVKEAVRWRPVDPLGLPHRSREADWYDGYYIPKGTICIANVWAMNGDPDIYGDDVREFNPSRHLDNNGKLAPGLAGTKDESHASFGFGRRICVGRHVANSSLFINFASILWACHIEPIKDEKDVPCMPNVDDSVNGGIVVRPLPFKCSISPRFPDASMVVSRMAENSNHGC